ncbi:MAG TPA: hypothetical protein VHA30_04450, partial [Patescibacteria group bacterium]|nr:hypothetical protein [Patescibacteria group bacterium]
AAEPAAAAEVGSEMPLGRLNLRPAGSAGTTGQNAATSGAETPSEPEAAEPGEQTAEMPPSAGQPAGAPLLNNLAQPLDSAGALPPQLPPAEEGGGPGAAGLAGLPEAAEEAAPAAELAGAAAPAAEAAGGALGSAEAGAEAGAALGPEGALAGAAIGALAGSRLGQELLSDTAGQVTSKVWWYGFTSSAAFFFTGLDLFIGAAVMDVYWIFLHRRNRALFPLSGWQKAVTVFANIFPLFLLAFFASVLMFVGCNWPVPASVSKYVNYRTTVIGAFIGDDCALFDVSNLQSASSALTGSGQSATAGTSAGKPATPAPVAPRGPGP